MSNVPSNVAAVMQAQGGLSPVCMLELQTAAGERYFWADAEIAAPSVIGRFDFGGAPVVTFEPKLLTPPVVKLTGTLVTQTATAVVGNLAGDTVERTLSRAFTRQKFWGALAYYRLYLPACEYTLIDFLGNVGDPEIDEEHMELPLTGFTNWSAIKAPLLKIDPSCSLTFGSQQCGSTSTTPCQNSYGTCSSIERFPGFLSQWTQAVTSPPLVQIAQPAPINVFNPRRRG